MAEKWAKEFGFKEAFLLTGKGRLIERRSGYRKLVRENESRKLSSEFRKTCSTIKLCEKGSLIGAFLRFTNLKENKVLQERLKTHTIVIPAEGDNREQ